MSWTYVQSSGKLYRPDGSLAGVGYAGGNGGIHPEGINNHGLQDARMIGPLPVGVYRRGMVVAQSHLGPFAIPLQPDAANIMFGRSAFYMHGDKATPQRSASDGCIIMARAVREEFYASDDSVLFVVEIKEATS